ncbi:MAG: PEP/pyruvate-binding domain-containing protein [bacterium]|nr:PEP/pyruvate-binding domain-containing protein [bacterium]
MIYIKTFDRIDKDAVREVGGKGAALGEMIKAGINVPSGFVITTKIFEKFQGKEISEEIKKEIFAGFDKLNAKRVAVRSSAVAEDSSTASWAGQLETYLNVDKKSLISKIKQCWNSIKSERALQYASQQNLSKDQLLIAVVVQEMIESEASGVIFTINPVTNDQNEIMIEAGFGLGEMIVQGEITPNNFILDKKTLEIKSKDIQNQDKMLVFRDGKNVEVPVSENKKNKQTISDDLIKKLGEIAIKIENHYQVPQDIEWAIDNAQKIWILQSRPVTTI